MGSLATVADPKPPGAVTRWWEEPGHDSLRSLLQLLLLDSCSSHSPSCIPPGYLPSILRAHEKSVSIGRARACFTDEAVLGRWVQTGADAQEVRTIPLHSEQRLPHPRPPRSSIESRDPDACQRWQGVWLPRLHMRS